MKKENMFEKINMIGIFTLWWYTHCHATGCSINMHDFTISGKVRFFLIKQSMTDHPIAIIGESVALYSYYWLIEIRKRWQWWYQQTEEVLMTKFPLQLLSPCLIFLK